MLCRAQAAWRTSTQVVSKCNFHSSAAQFAKKHPKQIKKENLAKRAAKAAEFERSKPSPIVSQHTSFFETLHTPASAYASSEDTQHFLTKADRDFLFEQTPRDTVEASNLGAVEGVDEALKHEQSKVDIMKKLVGLQNGNAKAVQLWNIQRTIDWFQKKPGDTGSPEVQAGILTVRIHNLYSHLQQHRKDKHNYKQLRSMVHKRAKILKYLKSKDLERYNTCLNQLGLQPRAVEGEITL
ncbi:s15 ns1 rna-binding domain-containing protein [Lichtheimia corymbifera JMRC:FSU:9682]|uniref:S15 ns1 rna-binding domain-containing protein n=1 Tax=Lichtheimia corymbifera JMRC:FSU:9682 TaxID=1263082 RepID=A0A068RJ48_9FUNG|nr:s15 ns1 rna-binding domain-containing protein [Lichtheimia corymbifera JMRC:FSU:9682]